MDVYRVTAIALTVVGLVFLAGVPFLLKRWLYRIVSMFLGLATLAGAAYQAHKGYEVWADDKRVRDIHEIAKVVDEFFRRTGRYPLESLSSAAPVATNITIANLPEEYRHPPPGASGSIVPYKVFLGELRDALGNELELPLEPTRVATHAPNFYQYLYREGRYYLSVNLYFERPGTRKLAPHYFKYELVGGKGLETGPLHD